MSDSRKGSFNFSILDAFSPRLKLKKKDKSQTSSEKQSPSKHQSLPPSNSYENNPPLSPTSTSQSQTENLEDDFKTSSEEEIITQQDDDDEISSRSHLSVSCGDLPVLVNLADIPQNHRAVSVIQKYILMWNGQIEFLMRCCWHIERTYIVQEIVSTEESYVNGLTVIIKDVYDPVVKAEEPLVEQNVIKSLFPEGHITIIHQAHSGVLSELKQRREHWSPQQRVGDIFLEMCKFLRLYTKYAETFTQVEQTLESLKKDKKFYHYLKEKWSDKADPFVYLSSLLITPIQRIPRYQLLLDSLYRKTWPSHRDYDALGAALAEMKKTAQYVNDKAKEGDKTKKILQIESALVGLKKPLAAASRKFIKEGVLYHRSIKGEWKKRYFFLFNDCMVRARFNGRQKGSYVFIEKVTLRQGQVWFLLQSDLEDEIDPKDRNRYFEFTQPHPLRYVLCAPTVEDKLEWCNTIQRAIDEINEADKEHQEVRKKISSQKAHMAKNLITVSFMSRSPDGQKTLTTSGGNSSNGSSSAPNSPATAAKYLTADSTHIRAYKEHYMAIKMTQQQKWEETKKTEVDVQNWEKNQKRKEDAKKIEEALQKNHKKKDIQDQLGYREVRKYHQMIQDMKNGRNGEKTLDES